MPRPPPHHFDPLTSYRTLHIAGTGAMGEVWRAEHVRTGIAVAIKRLPSPSDARLRAFHDAEIRANAALDHPSIVRIVDVGTLPDDSRWLALEWCGGGTLSGLTTWDEVEAVTRQILAALAHAHARGVVHRDIKPGNILRDELGAWKLADFGVARVGSVAVDQVVGSPPYIAPELLTPYPHRHGPSVDLYSLGCTLWEQVSGRPPFRGRPEQILEKQRFAPLPQLTASFPLPPGFEGWLRTLLDKDPSRRPATAALALRTFDEALGRGVPLQIPRRHEPDQAPGRDLRLRDAGAALLRYRRPRLFGREAILDRLWRELAGVVDTGRPRVVVLTGPLGVGRSRIATSFAQSVMEKGFGSWGRAELSRAGLSELEDVFGGLTPDAVSTWRDDRPAVVVVDDLADPTSARALGDLVVRCGGPVLWVVTAELLPEQLTKRLHADDWACMGVERFTHGQLGQLLRETLTLAPELNSAVARTAEGLPGRALRQLEQWAARGALTPTDGGFELEEATERGMPDATRRALELVALAGGSLEIEPWETACERAGFPVQWRAIMAFAAEGGVRIEPHRNGGRIVLAAGPATTWSRDALVRGDAKGSEALLACLPAGDLRRGLLLEAVGRVPAAVDALLQAARDRRRVGDRGRALELTHHAVRAVESLEGVDPHRLWAARNFLTLLWIDTWQVERALRALETWQDELVGAPAEHRAEAEVRLATALRYLGRHDEAVTVLSRAEQQIRSEVVDDDVCSGVLHSIASQLVSMGRGEGMLELALESLELARSDESRAYAALTLGRIRAWRREDIEAAEILERGLVWAESADRRVTRVTLLSMLGENYSRMGDLNAASRHLGSACELAKTIPNFDAVMLEINSLCNDLRLGRFEPALRTADGLQHDPRVRRLTIARVGVSMVRTVALAGLQRWDDLLEAADDFLGFLDKYPRLSDPDFAAFATLCRELAQAGPPTVLSLMDELVESTQTALA